MRKLLLSAPLLLAACGGPTTDTPDAETAPADAAPPDAYVPGPNAVTVTATGATYVAYRDGAGPWLAAKHLSGDDYQLDVTDDYRLVVSCGAPGGFDVEVDAYTFADGNQQYAYCFAPSGVANLGGGDVTVSGQMLQPGSVWLGGQFTGTTSPWSFAIPVAPGTYDLFGFSADHALLRRDLAITADTTVPDVDTETEGAPMPTQALTIDGALPDDSLYTNVSWSTANAYASLPGNGASVQLPPASLLSPNDWEYLDIDAYTGSADRHASASFVGTPPTTYTMLPRLDNVVFATDHGGDIAKFQTVPAADRLSFYSFDNTDSSMMAFVASASWLASTQARVVGFGDLPSDLDFQLDPNSAHFVDLQIEQAGADNVYYSSSVYDQVGGVAQQPASFLHRIAALHRARVKAAMTQR